MGDNSRDEKKRNKTVVLLKLVSQTIKFKNRKKNIHVRYNNAIGSLTYKNSKIKQNIIKIK